jgi:hypothetical protein
MSRWRHRTICQQYYSRVVRVFGGYWEQSLSIGSVIALDSGEVHGSGYVSLFGMTDFVSVIVHVRVVAANMNVPLH